MSKVGRNDPCPCGSGKKYKKCCLDLERDNAKRHEDFITGSRPDVDEAVDRALQRLEAGEGKSVESEIVKLLGDNPDYHMTNYAMGVYLARVATDANAARSYFEKAVAILPSFPEAHFNLANCARQSLDIPTAIESYRAAVRYSQGDEITEMAQKELQWLETNLLKATPFRDLDAYVANSRLFCRALECLTNREFDQAATLFQRVLDDNPNHVQSHGNLGLALAGIGRRADAIASLWRALQLDPDYELAKDNMRAITIMREGEPFIPKSIGKVEYYADQVRAKEGR